MKTILVPLTLSSDSCPALAIAGNLASESKARLVLLHVVQLSIAGEERGFPRARLLQELGRNAEIRLRELAGGMGGETPAEILVCEGRPAEAIVETARRLQADTIVMLTNRRRGWLPWLRRDTALHVARQAPCRTWLVCPGKHAGTLHLMVVDHTRTSRLAGRVGFRKGQTPSRSLARVLLS